MSIERMGIFYDGGYLHEAMKFFKFQRQAKLTIEDIERFARDQAAKFLKQDAALIQIVTKQYFRGRFSASTTIARNKLEQERIIEEKLLKAGVQPHFFPVDESQEPAREKGIDVWLSLNAYHELANNTLDILVLVAGDADYVPLLRKAKARGAITEIIVWDFEYEFQQGDKTIKKSTQSSQLLQNEALIVGRMC